MDPTSKFGGLDIAIRVDSTCLEGLELKMKEGVLEQISQKVWNNSDYDTIARDMLTIQQHELFRSIGYDRTGVGDGARRLFNRQIPLRDVLLSAPKKFEIITTMKGLIAQEKLFIHDKDLYREILEQEKIISEAGNPLYRHPTGFHDDRFWALGLAVDQAAPYVLGRPMPSIASTTPDRSLIDLADEAIMKDI